MKQSSDTRRPVCDLCGLPLGAGSLTVSSGPGAGRFCCRGCAQVYQAADSAGLLQTLAPVVGSERRPPPTTANDSPRPRPITSRFVLDGMWCPGCAVAAERILRDEGGVLEADVSFAAGMGRIRYDQARIDIDRLLERLGGLGYRPRLLTDAGEAPAEARQQHILLQLVTAAGFGMQVMVIYLQILYPLYAAGLSAGTEARNLHYLAWLLTTPILFYGGSTFLIGAWRALLARTATMDTLVTLGAISAYAYSVFVTITGRGETYFDSVGMITTFVMAGRYLESLGSAQARKDVGALLRLQPRLAWRADGGSWQQVDASSLAPGDSILVKLGERVPADATVLTGLAAADESLLTGESLPVAKAPGDSILAGSLITDNAVTARVTAGPARSRLAQIAEMVEQALTSRPPVQLLADRASGYFAAGILGTAAVSALAWTIAGYPASQALLIAVAVLVVACPCALGLATPLAITVALGQAAQAGVLLRNPAALETAPRLSRLVFDKTGTLTLGALTVAGVVTDPASETSPESLICLAAAVEEYSSHPIARAVVSACRGRRPAAHDLAVQPGAGAAATLDDGRRVSVGNAAMIGIAGGSPLAMQANQRADAGETVIWVGIDGRPAGFIALRDAPNPTARAAMGDLAARGLRTSIVSGDNSRTVKTIARELAVADYHGDCSPADKIRLVREWQAAGERVGMIGDGVNDAPALAQADLSITTSAGTDAAGATSDVVLMRQDLSLIPWFLTLSRRTTRTIRENLAWAFAYNLITVPLAVLGHITPVVAAIAMAVSSLLVVANSLRLGATLPRSEPADARPASAVRRSIPLVPGALKNERPTA